MATSPTLIALYSGLIIHRDAISGSLLSKLAALRQAQDEIQVDVVAFCQHTDVDDPAIEVIQGGVPDLMHRETFRRAALHIFEFGIHYDLFNVALMLPSEQMAAVYHNITPRELIPDPIVRSAIERSLNQKHLLARMSKVACVSDLNRRDLIEFGIPEDRLSVLPLPVLTDAWPGSPRGTRSSAEPVRFLFVGRIVKAKGILDLISAAERLVESGETGFELRIAGRAEFGDQITGNAIRNALDSSSLAAILRFTPDVPSDELVDAYRTADAFMMPSYHEGYCVPILEALAAACPVIAYDNSNIPMVSSGLAELVPTGDVDGLARAMRRTVESLRAARSTGQPYVVSTTSGPMQENKWRLAAHRRVSGLRNEHDRGLVAIVRDLLDRQSQASGTESTLEERDPLRIPHAAVKA